MAEVFDLQASDCVSLDEALRCDAPARAVVAEGGQTIEPDGSRRRYSFDGGRESYSVDPVEFRRRLEESLGGAGDVR